MLFRLVNDRGTIRDGWKSVFFLLGCMACFAVVGLVGPLWPSALKVFAPNALLIATLGLLLTVIALRLEGRSLREAGLHADRRFLQQLGLGLAGGIVLVGIAAALVSLAGVDLRRVEAPSPALHAKFALMVFGGAVFEELLFRGYAFQKAVRGLGQGRAIALFSLLFAVGHLPGNTGMETTMFVIAFAGLVLFTVIASLLLLRTGSLAAPIGLHAGWNLVQGLLGFGVSGLSHPAWFRPVPGHGPGWLTGGDYGLEASVLVLALDGLLLAGLLWRPRGAR